MKSTVSLTHFFVEAHADVPEDNENHEDCKKLCLQSLDRGRDLKERKSNVERLKQGNGQRSDDVRQSAN